MSYGKDRVYKKVELIGVSGESIEAAIQVALRRTEKSVERLSWFEVETIHGHVGPDGQVAEYQVLLKASFEVK